MTAMLWLYALALRSSVIKPGEYIVNSDNWRRKRVSLKPPKLGPSHDYSELSEIGPRKVTGVLSPVLPMLSLHVQG